VRSWLFLRGRLGEELLEPLEVVWTDLRLSCEMRETQQYLTVQRIHAERSDPNDEEGRKEGNQEKHTSFSCVPPLLASSGCLSRTGSFAASYHDCPWRQMRSLVVAG
jgi:hypothetical protein